jgi:outer membrane protein OmpA-like peptidoglycan-associated protein
MWCAAVAVFLVPGFEALAQGTETYFATPPTESELIEALRPKQRLKTRGLQPTTVTPAESNPAVALDIQFEFDSAALTDNARAQLNVLGAAITSTELRDYRYRLTGHTDSIGSASYNMRLSKARARSVRNYLITAFNIEPTTLQNVGKGETEPRDPGNPEADINRRVVILNLGK